MTAPLSPAALLGEPKRDLSPADLWAERLRILLSTRPGSIPWRPTFGVDLEWLVGKPLSMVHLNMMKWRVRSALEQWLPQLAIRELKTRVVSDYGVGERDRSIPLAESALLPYGAGGRVEIHLEVVSPDGPLDFDMTLSE